MNKLLLTVAAALLLGAPGLLAQELIPTQNDKGKWGYADEQGNVVIKYDYAEVSAFVDGRAKVKKGDKWGYIDTAGKEVIKIQYSEMGTWENGRCKVAVGVPGDGDRVGGDLRCGQVAARDGDGVGVRDRSHAA